MIARLGAGFRGIPVKELVIKIQNMEVNKNEAVDYNTVGWSNFD